MTRLAERIYRTEGVILRNTELGEADRILTLYTAQYGKLRAIAKRGAPPRGASYAAISNSSRAPA